MKKYLYAYYNTLAGFYSAPFVADIVPDDYPEAFKMSIVQCDPKVLTSLLEDDLYYLGTMETQTGDIVMDKKFVLHCGESARLVLDNLIKVNEKKEGEADENA